MNVLRDSRAELEAMSRPKRKITFTKGELVEVTHGELQFLMGTVVRVDGPNVVITPKHKDLVRCRQGRLVVLLGEESASTTSNSRASCVETRLGDPRGAVAEVFPNRRSRQGACGPLRGRDRPDRATR